jgi:hypothetical protein
METAKKKIRPKTKRSNQPTNVTRNKPATNTRKLVTISEKSRAPSRAPTPVPRTRQIVPKKITDIAFLFLTYDDITHDKTKKFIENHSVYVNAKNPQTIKGYVISRHETSWAAKSIVDATIKMLENAYKNGHEWYVLLAYDVYPLVTIDEFTQFLKFQTKSMFHVMKQHENEWKASQWWILCRADVETILSRYREYDDYLTKVKYTMNNETVKDAAWDELYFLSLLKYVNPAYVFLEHKTVYVEWLKNSKQSHPVIYNKILHQDLEKMKGSFFLRKTTPTFTIEPVSLKKRLVIKIYGTETRDFVPEDDFILLSILKKDTISEELKSKSLYMYHVHYSSVYISVLEILETIPVYLWEEVVVLTETCNTVPEFKGLERCTLPNMSLSTPKQFYGLDGAFLYSPYKIAFLFLTIGDIHQPNVWTKYFKENQHKVSIYTHAKFPEKIVTPWMKNVIPTVDTAWGKITNAYYHLFQEAAKDPNNVKFVTISESCIPLKKFDVFYDTVTEDIRTSYVKFMDRSNYDTEDRIKTQPGYERYEPFIKHYARMCLSRYHVEKLLKEPFDFFNNMHVGDEFFLTLLHLEPGVDFVKDFEITYDNWEPKEKYKQLTAEINKLKEQQKRDNSFLIEDKIRIKKALRKVAANNPRTYTTIGVKELEEALNKESFFWRKFPEGPLPWTNELLTLDKPKARIQPFIAARRAANKRERV